MLWIGTSESSVGSFFVNAAIDRFGVDTGSESVSGPRFSRPKSRNRLESLNS